MVRIQQQEMMRFMCFGNGEKGFDELESKT